MTTEFPEPMEETVADPRVASEEELSIAPHVAAAEAALGEESAAEEAFDPAAEANPQEESRRRSELQQRIRTSRRLPRGLQQRLLELAEASRFAAGRETAALTVTDALHLLEESLPDHVRLRPDQLDRPEHPRGDGFFTGNTELSDEAAAAIAQGQLARTGYGRRT